MIKENDLDISPLLKILVNNYAVSKTIIQTQARIIAHLENKNEIEVFEELSVQANHMNNATLLEFASLLEAEFPGFRKALLDALENKKE